MSADACPTSEQIHQVVRGAADEASREAILRHAETCPDCARSLDGLLHQGDRLVGRNPQADLPVAAERARMWARRNPAVAAALALAVFVLVVGAAASTWFGLDARAQAEVARDQKQDALAARDLAEVAEKRVREALAKANEARKQALADRNKAQTAETLARQEKSSADLRAAELTFRLALQQVEAGAVDRGLFLMLRAWRQTPEDAVSFRAVIRANLAGWTRQLPRLRQAVLVQEHAGRSRQLFVGDPEGRTFLTRYHDRPLRCWDSATGQLCGKPLFPDGKIDLHSVSPDGRLLSVTAGGIRSVFDRATGKVVAGVSWPETERGAAFFDDLPDVVWASEKEERLFWDLRTGKQLPGRVRLGKGEWFRLTRTSDGRPAALVFPVTPLRIVDLSTGKSGTLSLAGGSGPTISRDGRIALDWSKFRGAATWWDLAAGRLLGDPWLPRRRSDFVGLGRDGMEVLASGIDDRLRLFDLTTGLQRGGDVPGNPRNRSFGLAAWGQEDDGLMAATTGAPSPDGRLVWTLTDGVARVWDVGLCKLQATVTANPRLRPVDLGEKQPRRAHFSPDGRRVVLTWREKHFAVLLDARTGEPLGPPLRQLLLEHVVFSPDGRRLATAPRPHEGVAPMVVLRDGVTGKPIGKPWTSPKLIHALAFSPDNKTLAVGAVGGVFILDAPALTLRHTLPEATCTADLKFHPDGRRLAVMAKGGWEGVRAGQRIWDVWTGKALAPFRGGSGDPWGPVAAWDAGEGEDALTSFAAHQSAWTRYSADGKEVRGGPWSTGGVRLVGFSKDGRRLVAAASAVNVQQWDTRTGKFSGPALVHPDPPRMIRYSPDRQLLAVACDGGAVRLWDAETGWPLGPPLYHVSPPIEMIFTDQNRTLLTITDAGAVHAWPTPRPVQGGKDGPDRFAAWMGARGGVRVVGEEAVQRTLAEWQTACVTLAKRWPPSDPALVEASDDLADWHRWRALDAEEAGNDRGELYHLTRLAELCPRELAVHARIARVHARVAPRLPAGLARDHEWQLAQAAMKRGRDRPGEDDWNRARALEASVRQSWDESAWYLDILIAKHSSDWMLYAERGEIHGERRDKEKRDADLRQALARGGNKNSGFVGKVADVWAREDRWRETTRMLTDALKNGPADAALVRRLALSQLKFGDRAGHARLCRDVLRNLPQKLNVNLAVALAEMCALSPEALENWSAPLAWMEGIVGNLEKAERATKSPQEKGMLKGMRRSALAAYAGLLHRAGKRVEAVDRLKEAMKLSSDGGGGAKEWAWLALAHAAGEKGPFKEARRWLEKARAAMPKRDGPALWEAVLIEVLVDEVDKTMRRRETF